MNFEDDPRAFLVLIVQTLSVLIIWMMIHVLVGIYFGFGFFADMPGWENYLYYIFLLISLYFLIKYILNRWKF